MKTIPLRAVPNQRFTFSNGQDRWVIEIKVAISSMICNIWLNDEPVILGSRIVAGVPIIWSPRLATGGNFGILTEGGEEPWWEKFDTSQRLVFWESDMAIASSRFVDLRSRHISPSLAELTALVNTAMRIEDIGYYPPTWQALQEAISYAMSVVRSHAPEQGQILLATQMLTSAMGGLIEWLSIDFAAGEWDEDLVFSRASTGTYWGPEGSLLEAAVDEARIQHDPVTGEPLGLLVESSATNNYARTTPPEWINCDPVEFIQHDRFIDAYKVTAPVDERSGDHYFSWNNSTLFPTDGTVFSFSVTVKRLTENVREVWLGQRGSSYFPGRTSRSIFNFEDEVFTSETDNTEPGIVEYLGDGYYRITRIGTFEYSGIGIAFSDQNGNTDFSNDEVRELIVADIQVSPSTYPTTYIPTTDSPVTRAADNAVIDLSDVLNPDEGTFFFEFEAYVGGGGSQYVNFNNNFRFYESAVSATIQFTWGVGATQTLRSGVSPGYYRFKIALTYTGQQAQLVVRLDDEVSVRSTGTDFQIDNTLYLFNRPQGDRASDGIFKTVEYIPRAFIEAELVELTK